MEGGWDPRGRILLFQPESERQRDNVLALHHTLANDAW